MLLVEMIYNLSLTPPPVLLVSLAGLTSSVAQDETATESTDSNASV
ncbi:MAG: hypothetical protein HOP30_19625 [Cyclobacteriaceae bacterium]|nr:hypothetical protein [Cyclobacteriaceae bacterium]